MNLTWKKFLFSFEGRVNRKSFWMYHGATYGALAAASMLVFLNAWVAAIMMLLVLAGASWSGLAINSKRLHDVGASGKMQLIAAAPVLLLPLISWTILIIVLGSIPGNKGENRFGLSPDGGTEPRRERASQDPFELLGVRPDAPREVIDAAYRTRAKVLHPDSGGSEWAMAELDRAYEAIRNTAFEPG